MLVLMVLVRVGCWMGLMGVVVLFWVLRIDEFWLVGDMDMMRWVLFFCIAFYIWFPTLITNTLTLIFLFSLYKEDHFYFQFPQNWEGASGINLTDLNGCWFGNMKVGYNNIRHWWTDYSGPAKKKNPRRNSPKRNSLSKSHLLHLCLSQPSMITRLK